MSARELRARSTQERQQAHNALANALKEHYDALHIEHQLQTLTEEIADAEHEREHAPTLQASLPLSLREQEQPPEQQQQQQQQRHDRADPWYGSMFTMNGLRGVVSKKKRRFQRGGFDLDLSYITPQILAMGFPSVGSETSYRNPMSEVQRFFHTYHPGHHKVFNLCCERGYAPHQFEKTAVYPFMDHNPPPITMLFDAVEAVYGYVIEDHRNVAAVHCKAGKGRTGVVVCCFLLRCGEHVSAEDALRYYGVVRTSNGKGVTIASQKRYIDYYSAIVECGVPRAVLANPVTRTLVGIRVRGTPRGGCNGMYFKVMQDVTFVDGEVASNKWKSTSHAANSRKAVKPDPGYVLDVRADLPVRGDVLVQCCDKVSLLSGGGTKKLFHFWFHTFFVRDNYMCLTKFEIDGPHKDKKDVKWFEDFQVELFFANDTERHDWRTSVAGWEETAARAAASQVGRAAGAKSTSPQEAVQAARRSRSRKLSEQWQRSPVSPDTAPDAGERVAGAEPPLPALDGWLGKKTGQRWKLRHFVLQPSLGVLKYYDDENAKREVTGRKRAQTKVTQGTRGILLKEIELSSIQPFFDDDAESKHDHREFQFKYADKVYQLRARDEDARDQWVAALTKAVRRAKDMTTPLSSRLAPEPVAMPEPAPEPPTSPWEVATMKLAADEIQRSSTRALQIEAEVQQAGGHNVANSFPSDLPHQLGLASAMLSMQGYDTHTLMAEQRRMSSLLNAATHRKPTIAQLAAQADTLLAAGDLGGAEALLAAAEAAHAQLDVDGEVDTVWEGDDDDADTASPASVYFSPQDEDFRGFSDDSDIDHPEDAPAIPAWRPSIAGSPE